MNEQLEKWLDLKQAETKIKDELATIEKDLIESGAFDLIEDGSKTTTLENYKVTVKSPVYRTLDTDKWEEIKLSIPPTLRPVKEKIVLDEKGYKWLRDNEPEIFSNICYAVTEKPGKINIKVVKK